ncbi:hypothetical protein BC835DRAFT_1336796 [Cytidiella melzeri]|nr:hypothetical protein BC835DRAFT_1336796 [Cytidiella melzeri]
MSLRKRNTFKSSETGDEDQGPILDEQEQEQLINLLKKDSAAKNARYAGLLQGLVGISAILHLMYLSSSTGESPFAAVLPPGSTSSRPLPVAPFFSSVALFIHVNLFLRLLPSAHFIRRSVSSTFAGHVPLRYTFIFAMAAVAPVLSLALWQSWADVLWWCTTVCLVYWIYTAQSWFEQEAEEIKQLEKLQYDAKGA